jgi:uncharacterized membrane protein
MAPLVPVLIGCWCLSGVVPMAMERDKVRAVVNHFADRITMSDDQEEYDSNARNIFIGMFVFALLCGPYVLIKLLGRPRP